MSRRRRVAIGVVLAGFAAALLAGVAAASVVGARTDLTAARAAVAEARTALAGADPEAATASFGRAGERFRAGHARLGSPPVRIVARVPGVRANVRATRRLAAAGAQVSDAGAEVTGALAALPGGLEAFAPREGRVPLEPIAAMAGPLAAADDRLGDAETLAAGTPATGLVGPVADARAELVEQLAGVSATVRAAAALAGQLPAFLGADGPRRYFVGAQNPAELRGTGGLIGAFGILTVDQGQVDISEFRNITDLTLAAPEELPPPSADYASRYSRFRAGVHGSNVNMTPDVPTAAVAIETLYQAATGETVDGTILTDPLFLQALLTLVGPTDVPDVGRVSAEDVVAFATREQYEVLGDAGAADRKEALGEVAGAVLRRFLAGDADPRQAVTALGGAVGDGRLRLHATDPAVQAAFATAGIHGALADPDGDYVAVAANNTAGNKLDTFLRQELAYDAVLQADGSVRGRLTLTVTNTAPTSGFHSTVLGPFLDSLEAGENRTLWSVYCAPGCRLTAFHRDGEAANVSIERERGRPVFATTVTLASGASQTLEYAWTVPGAWAPDEGAQGYGLAVDGQPGLVEGATTVRVSPGEGVADLTGAPPMATHDGTATWTGAPSDRVVLTAGTVPVARGFGQRVADFFGDLLPDRSADAVDAGGRAGTARWAGAAWWTGPAR